MSTSRFLNADDVSALTHIAAPLPVIEADELVDRTPRTLIYGYTTDRNTFHIWFDHGMIHKAIYHIPAHASPVLISFVAGFSIVAATAVPDKRIYPERCDLEFCTLIRDRGVRLPFTRYTPPTDPGPFYGATSFDDDDDLD